MFSRKRRNKPSPDEITESKKLLEESRREREESEQQLRHTKEISFSLARIREENHIVADIRKVLGGH